MAAATAALAETSHPAPSRCVRELEARCRHLARVNASLVERGRTLAARNDQLELELVSLRLRAGDLAPPAAVTDADTAALWLAWARHHHHSAACACHRCRRARRALAR